MATRWNFLDGFFWLSGESLRGFRRSGTAALAAAWSTALSCSLLFVFLLAWQSFESWSLQESQRQGWIEAFLPDTATNASLLPAIQALSSLPGVSETVPVTKEQAKEVFRAEFGSEFLNAVQGNPLPPSVRMKLAGTPSRELITALVTRVRQVPGIESVQAPEESLQDLQTLSLWARRAALVAALLLVGVVFGVVRNSIELSLRARHQLIDNMRILGASRFQIEAPFAAEGFIIGTLGGFLACAVPLLLLTATRGWIPLPLPFAPAMATQATLLTIGFASLTGLTGGWWTIHRALR